MCAQVLTLEYESHASQRVSDISLVSLVSLVSLDETCILQVCSYSEAQCMIAVLNLKLES
jgi:hypothetical protein